jgi:uncharacterized BrkB/YihY/UPF0761 family membrane protein
VPPLVRRDLLRRGDALYGTLGAAIGLMMWMWMWMSTIILFGAELNSEIGHQTAKDSPTTGTVSHARPNI